jgi:hypothetical protein
VFDTATFLDPAIRRLEDGAKPRRMPENETFQLGFVANRHQHGCRAAVSRHDYRTLRADVQVPTQPGLDLGNRGNPHSFNLWPAMKSWSRIFTPTARIRTWRRP